MTFEGIFTDIFEKNGLTAYIDPDTVTKFERLTEIMVATNAVMNITALTTLDKIVPLHYADCAKIAACIPRGARVIDVGCGGGFPILPLAILRPDLKITGLDSTDKKIKYVQNTADTLGLHVQTVSGRAEDVAKLADHRDAYDVAVSRAVARLNVLDELCLPFVRIGGSLLAMKGSAGREELDEACGGIQKLGGAVKEISEYDLVTCADSEKRVLICIEKLQATPKEFPRAFGAIKKKPL